jgi:hypothetical protein
MSFQCERCGCQHQGKAIKKWDMIICSQCKINIEEELPYLIADFEKEMEKEKNA